MSEEDKAKRILDEFMKNASPEELAELEKLLKERDRKRGSSGQIDVNGIAKDMAQQIQKQMGMTTENIKRMAKDMVVSLARQKQPDITDRELDALVREMVPDNRYVASESKIPPELLVTMIRHFISYSTGKMSQAELRNLPKGWVEKYWESFPIDVQKLISAYLKSEIGADMFWEGVSAVLHG